MATNDKHNLIGYDPLAWMGEDPDMEALAATEDDAVAIDGLAVNVVEEPDLLGLEAVNEQVTEPEEVVAEELALDLTDNLDSVGDADDGTGLGQDFEVTEDNLGLGDDAMGAEMVEEDLGQEQVEAKAVSAEPLIHLESNLTIQHVVKLHEILKASLSAFEQIEVDASAVSSIDTASLQLLVALKKEAEKSQKQVEISSASPRFVESAKLVGLAEILNVGV